MALEKPTLIATVIGLIIGAWGLAYTISDRTKPVVPSNARFQCELQADSKRGGEVWTVIYRQGNKTKPWLRMVRSMGGGWDTKRRCEEIARRLNDFRQDGLIGLEYRPDTNTPEQYVLCAKTKISSNNCPLVLTLWPKDDPYKELREVAGALLPGNPESYQGSGEITRTNPVAISLEGAL